MGGAVKSLTKAVGLSPKKPDPPAPVVPVQTETKKDPVEPPSRQDAEVVDVGADTRREEKARRGRASTRLTGATTLGDANIGRKKLLGS